MVTTGAKAAVLLVAPCIKWSEAAAALKLAGRPSSSSCAATSSVTAAAAAVTDRGDMVREGTSVGAVTKWLLVDRGGGGGGEHIIRGKIRFRLNT